ncbi:MAG TPA: zinc transporter ZupT [Elusimicrobia bacterium]|nr:zinc transporter ZupT [Elusimicrobiota bacterium]
MPSDRFLFALMLTTAAGMATGIGSAIAFFAKRSSPKFLASTLGFSAGVMIFMCLVEILPEARESLLAQFGPTAGPWIALAAFFGGIAFTGLIDTLVPSFENPHEARGIEEMTEERRAGDRRLMRMGLFSAFALSIHNLPEGLGTFMAGLQGPAVGLPIAFAIFLHNIPEGISVSVPIYFATGDRKKAFFYSFLTGFCEPVGALLGYLLLGPFLEKGFGLVLALVAGIMIYIAFDELLPAAHESGEHHCAVWGLIAGMAVIAVCMQAFT